MLTWPPVGKKTVIYVLVQGCGGQVKAPMGYRNTPQYEAREHTLYWASDEVHLGSLIRKNFMQMRFICQNTRNLMTQEFKMDVAHWKCSM